MLLFVVAACMIPLLIQGRLIAQSSRQMQVERRIIDVQNQCQILSNKMSRNGYLGNSGVDTSGTDTELSMLADIFNGRILIVNSGFRIVKDTFSLAEGMIRKSIILSWRCPLRIRSRRRMPGRVRKRRASCW